MKYKIVFSDIDGTVLTSSHHVLPSTTFAVKELLQKSIPFVLVSARMPQAIRTVTDEMNVNIPMISYGGALILDDRQNILHDRRISAEDTVAVIKEIKLLWQDSAIINYYAGNDWFVEDKDNKAVIREESITHVQAQQMNFAQLLAEGIVPNKLLCMTSPPVCEVMEKMLGEMFPQLKIMRSSPILLEIMDKTVSKAKGIKIMLKHFGLSANQAVAFGDNYNDLDMLDFIGLGVAMGNAPDDVKKIAFAVTEDNNRDGICKFLRKIKLID